jgi:ribosomal protein L7/L12
MRVDPEILEDGKRLHQAGAGRELLLVFFRDRGFDKIDSIRAIQSLLGVKFADAKDLVDLSQAWSDRYESDAELKEVARKALRQLAASLDLPRITLERDDK